MEKERPGPFYRMNDVSVYSCRQREGEGRGGKGRGGEGGGKGERRGGRRGRGEGIPDHILCVHS